MKIGQVATAVADTQYMLNFVTQLIKKVWPRYEAKADNEFQKNTKTKTKKKEKRVERLAINCKLALYSSITDRLPALSASRANQRRSIYQRRDWESHHYNIGAHRCIPHRTLVIKYQQSIV